MLLPLLVSVMPSVGWSQTMMPSQELRTAPGEDNDKGLRFARPCCCPLHLTISLSKTEPTTTTTKEAREGYCFTMKWSNTSECSVSRLNPARRKNNLYCDAELLETIEDINGVYREAYRTGIQLDSVRCFVPSGTDPALVVEEVKSVMASKTISVPDARANLNLVPKPQKCKDYNVLLESLKEKLKEPSVPLTFPTREVKASASEEQGATKAGSTEVPGQGGEQKGKSPQNQGGPKGKSPQNQSTSLQQQLLNLYLFIYSYMFMYRI
ncbi:hypothetical protein GCK32_005501 [Trichostrongylus colubriformis]|uniref:Uncharacterized protein n=1 Tax=Trichostrongylus colubriformis TaxID=6319 RepID=A0AAN8EY53_TRICO